MPLYVYSCPKCGLTEEKLEPFESEPPTCPSHPDEKMERCPTTWGLFYMEPIK